MPGPVTKKPSAVYTPPVSMRGVNALEGPEAVRQQFTDIVSTVLQDAAVEVGTYRDRFGRERESRFEQPPVEVEARQYPERSELVGRHPPALQGAEVPPNVPEAETWDPWTPRGPQVADRNPPVPPGMEGGAGMEGGTTAEAVEILGLGGGEPSLMGYTGEMEDRTDAGSRARIDAQRGELPGTLAGQQDLSGGGPADAPIVPENLPGGGYPEAETWEPWTPETPYDKRRVAQEQQSQNVADRHPEVVEVIEQVVAEKPVGLQEIIKNLGDQVVQIIESIRGFSISPEEAGQIFGMSPDQLKDAYNNLARQQGRTIYEDPQAWVNLGAPPFASKEAGAAFMGKVPAGGPTLGPGDPEYAQWNVPMEETTHGFSAKGYKASDVKGGPSPTSELRRLYPWAMNLSEDVLQRAVQDPDFLRQLIEMAESGQILPFQ